LIPPGFGVCFPPLLSDMPGEPPSFFLANQPNGCPALFCSRLDSHRRDSGAPAPPRHLTLLFISHPFLCFFFDHWLFPLPFLLGEACRSPSEILSVRVVQRSELLAPLLEPFIFGVLLPRGSRCLFHAGHLSTSRRLPYKNSKTVFWFSFPPRGIGAPTSRVIRNLDILSEL